MRMKEFMKPIVLATANPHKVAELREIFARKGIEVNGLSDAAPGMKLGEPEETGRTFEDNAAIKARAYAAQTGRACLADDSGLEVDALGGAPGVISSHYATGGRETGAPRAQRDLENNAKLLADLAGVPDDRRAARFVCVMCLAAPDGRILATSRGTFEGRIGQPGRVPRGAGGFGYDPLFLVAPDFLGSSAELAQETKNRLSHRGAAAREMAARLRSLVPSPLFPPRRP
jgi:XTP/dITP diphosphohydrolase